MLLKCICILLICSVNANEDDNAKDYPIDLSTNLVNLNQKCHNYIDCYNCTLARCEWGSRSDASCQVLDSEQCLSQTKRVFECKMPVVNNYEHHDDEDMDKGPIRKDKTYECQRDE